MEKHTKQQVRKNRQRLRNNIKTYITAESHQNPEKNFNNSKIFTPQTILKRHQKSSHDFLFEDDFSTLKQVYLQNPFDQLFELQQKIGEGCHSSVYKCKQIKTGKIYAVKSFKFVQQQNIRHLKQHYSINKNLNHENILKAYYLFINQKLKKIDMICQYCPYYDLRKFINKNKNIKQSTLAQILYSIINGINYLHRHGVCHRDIKPQNILYNPATKELKIIDFQIAKMRKYTYQRIQMWTNTGTLQYKAPEMFKGCYDEAIDIWAVGVIAYELAYKKLPFDRQYLCDTITAICDTQPQYQGVNIDPFLLHFIKRCLTKNIIKRITAFQALKTPFILKHLQQSSPKSKLKKKNTPNTDKESQITDTEYKKKLKQLPKKSFCEDDIEKQRFRYEQDIGIRFIQH